MYVILRIVLALEHLQNVQANTHTHTPARHSCQHSRDGRAWAIVVCVCVCGTYTQCAVRGGVKAHAHMCGGRCGGGGGDSMRHTEGSLAKYHIYVYDWKTCARVSRTNVCHIQH